MIFYVLLLCAVICASICVSFAKDKSAILIAKIITFNLLFIPAALQYGIGEDYFDYVKIYNGIPFGRFVNIELGWRWLNLAVYNLGGTAQTVIALTAFLSLFFLFCEVDNKKWFLYAPVCMIMIYMWLFTTLRQMLCMSMVFCAMQRVQKKKYVIAMLLVIGSYFFHKSAVIYIPIFFLCYFIHSKPGFCCFFYFIVIIIANLFSNTVNSYLLNLIGLSRYSVYLSMNWINATDPGAGRFVRYLVHGTMLLLFPIERQAKTVFLNILFLYCVIDCYALNIQIINRISRGLLFVFMPVMWLVWNCKKNRQLLVFIYIFCFLLLFLRNYNGMEYVSIFG